MDSILFIREGDQASAIAECVLRRENVVVSRTDGGAEAILQLNQQPFDAIVLAIDDLEPDARSCLNLINDESVPKVIVTGDSSIQVQSFDINTRVVSIEDGIEAVGKALRQQFGRITKRFPVNANDGSYEFAFKFRADPDRVSRARTIAGGFIQRCVDIDDLEFTRMELAMEEALLNAVLHGSLELTPTIIAGDVDDYVAVLNKRLKTQPYCDRQVSVGIVVQNEQLAISVSDVGPGFDASAAMSGQESGSMKAYGRGLMLMHAFADSIEFNATGNSVTLVRNCRSRQPATAVPKVSFETSDETASEVVMPERNRS